MLRPVLNHQHNHNHNQTMNHQHNHNHNQTMNHQHNHNHNQTMNHQHNHNHNQTMNHQHRILVNLAPVQRKSIEMIVLKSHPTTIAISIKKKKNKSDQIGCV